MPASSEIATLSGRTNISLVLASRMVGMIEESGAAQTEVLAALGVVQCLLPTLGIPIVNDEAELSPQES